MICDIEDGSKHSDMALGRKFRSHILIRIDGQTFRLLEPTSHRRPIRGYSRARLLKAPGRAPNAGSTSSTSKRKIFIVVEKGSLTRAKSLLKKAERDVASLNYKKIHRKILNDLFRLKRRENPKQNFPSIFCI